MIGRYALPSDDLLHRLSPTLSASAEDPDYPLTNWAFRQPARPVKLTTTTGWWEFDFGTAVNVAALALLYHNFDAGMAVTLKWGTAAGLASPAGTQAIPLSASTEDFWTVSPWIEVTGSPTYQFWRIEVEGSPGNTIPLVLGRPHFVGALRDLGHDVRWGVEEVEQHGLIEHLTELGVETIYALGGKRRSFSGEFGLINIEADTLISLVRSALGRTYPWLLIPDVDVNDAWFVRFDESRYSRVRENPNHNEFPFRVTELSRGLPWP